LGEEALILLLCRSLLLYIGLRCVLKLLLLCWVAVMALRSVVERLRLLSTLPLPLLLRGMARYSPHSFMYECAQITSICVSSQLMDQLMGLGLRPGLYLSDETSRFVALVLECTITATQG
jgi:hypothetical protein